MKGLCASILFILPLIAKAQFITTIAGGGAGGDGSPAISASVITPEYMTFDGHGNLYFTQDNNKVRKIDSSGIITTIAGTGTAGFSGDNGLASAAKLNQPCGIAIDSAGDIFIADNQNNRIRKIDAVTGIITTIAGSGIAGFSGDNGPANAATLYWPAGLCFDRYGNLYIGDYGNHRIRKINTTGIITTIAGNGLVGWDGTGGPALSASISPSNGLFVDGHDNVYISEWTYGTIRKIDSFGIITLVAGDTSSHYYNGDSISKIDAHIDPFFTLCDNNGNIYFSDAINNRIRKIDLNNIIYTVAGTGIAGTTGDNGPADSAQIHTPSGMAIDNCGNICFGQINTPRIRKVTFNPNCWPESVKEVNSESSVNIYPNPVKEQLTVAGGSSIKDILVLNTIGQVLIEQKNYNNKGIIDVSALSTGIYFIKVIDSSGAETVKRFLKE